MDLMSYPPNLVQYFARPSRGNLRGPASTSSNWDSSVTFNEINYHSSSSSSSRPGSSNSIQHSPSTPKVPNYQPPTKDGFMPKISADGFYFDALEDWISWDDHTERALSSSPTRFSVPAAATPPAICFKAETSLSPTVDPVSFEIATSSDLNHYGSITQNGFMGNPVCVENPENFFPNPSQHTAQRYLVDIEPLQNQRGVCPVPVSYPSESSLDFNTNGNYQNDNSGINNVTTALQMDSLGGVSMHSFPLLPPCQQPQRHMDNRQQEIQEKQLEDYVSSATERSETDSSGSRDGSSPSRPSPPPHLQLEIPSYKQVDLQSLNKKRKSNYDFSGQARRCSSPDAFNYDTQPSVSPNTPGETLADGDVPSIGRTRPPKKTAHNMIEKRYRTNLNDKIAALRDAVPSLRIAIRCDNGLVREGAEIIKGTEKDEQRDTRSARLAKRETPNRLEVDREDLQGLTAANKLNKATILAKATEYISHLENRNRILMEEREALRGRIDAYEILNLSVKTGERGKIRIGRPMEF